MAPFSKIPHQRGRQRVVVKTWQYAIGNPKRVHTADTFGETITRGVVVSL